MKMQMLLIAAAAIIAGCEDAAITVETAATASTPVKDDIELYIDVHNLEPGKVTFDAVMDAHRKDLATQGKYGVQFHKFWVDEEKGKVYCLSSAANAEAVSNTHKEAHGLLPISVHQVRDGVEDPAVGN